MIDEIIDKVKGQMEEVIELVADDLKGVKTGRAKPSLIEDVKVQVYGTSMSLKELASISAPDPHTLIVSAWDKAIVKAIEKGINNSDLNLHPVVDNDLVRISIPLLTEESRQDLVKLVNQKLESGRRLLRQTRNEAKKQIDDLKGKPGVSEDNLRDWYKELQKIVDQYNARIEELGKVKEKEVLTI